MRLRAVILALLLAVPASADYTSTILDDDPCTFWHMENAGDGTPETNVGSAGVSNDADHGTDGVFGSSANQTSVTQPGIPNRPTAKATHFTSSNPSIFGGTLAYSDFCVGSADDTKEANPCTQDVPPATIGNEAPNDFTAECWVKTQSAADQTIIGRGSGTDAFSWLMFLSSASKWAGRMYIDSPGSSLKYQAVSSSSYSTGVWYYMVMRTRANLTPVIEILVDTTSVATTTTDLCTACDSGSPRNCGTGGNRIWVGAFTDETKSFPANADIDECAIYNDDLSDARLLAHFTASDGGGNIWPWTAKRPQLPLHRDDGYFAKLVQRGYVTTGLFTPRERQPQHIPLAWLPVGVYPSNSSTR